VARVRWIEAEENYRDVYLAAIATSHELQELAEILPLMINLTTFSLYVDPCGKDLSSRTDIISRRCVIQLLGALPPSCVDIEVDTKGQELYLTVEEEDNGHMCEAFTPLFSRIRHARIRIKAACSSLVGEWPGLTYSKPDDSTLFKPVSMPSLKTFLISAQMRPVSAIRVNCGGGESTYMEVDRTMLYKALKRIIKHPHVPPPPDANIYMVFWCANVFNWHGIYRTNPVDDTSHITPFLYAGFTESGEINRYLARTSEKQIFTPLFSEVQELAEGELWRNFQGGERLPAAVLSSNKGYHPYVRACRELRRPMTLEEQTFLRPETEARVGRMLMCSKKVNGVCHGHILPHLTEEEALGI
jgi:hypothetical protein